tara:strand:+ start:270 stop:644 length:375 start_codon:yes stop_codon:yes gene_type:complete
MLILLIVCLIAAAVYQLAALEEPITVSTHTKQFNRITLLAIFRALQSIEKQYDKDIQFLINAGVVSKSDIEIEADKIMIQWQEFTTEKLCIDAQDFARLINVHTKLLKNANDLQIKYVIDIMYL